MVILKVIIKYIWRGIICFFNFIFYLNFLIIKEVFNCVVKKRLLGLFAEMVYNVMLVLFFVLLIIIAVIGLFEFLSLILF